MCSAQLCIIIGKMLHVALACHLDTFIYVNKMLEQ